MNLSFVYFVCLSMSWHRWFLRVSKHISIRETLLCSQNFPEISFAIKRQSREKCEIHNINDVLERCA